MIDYSELDKYYIGEAWPVIMNAGGILLELGDKTPSLFYKIDDDHYADVNRNGAVAQVLKDGAVIKTMLVVEEGSLRPVNGKAELKSNSSAIKRFKFKPKDYKKESPRS